MFTPRHPKPLLSTRAVAMQVVKQEQARKAVDKHVLIVGSIAPKGQLPTMPTMPPAPEKPA